MNVYTVGYEGVTLENFLARLQRACVRTVVDVRDLPLSRKPGFSKTALAAAIAAAGMDYMHVRSLGCPKPIRDQFRVDNNWDAYTVAFMQHLRRQSTAVRELVTVCQESAAALLCYEADFNFCHRTYVARAVAAHFAGAVLHIGAAGVTPDRNIPAAG